MLRLDVQSLQALGLQVVPAALLHQGIYNEHNQHKIDVVHELKRHQSQVQKNNPQQDEVLEEQ